MLQINRYENGRWRNLALHDLRIGDTWAHKLPGPDLYQELRKLKLDVSPSMGWQQLATVYANHLADLKEAATNGK
jgi:hypothetical protein